MVRLGRWERSIRQTRSSSEIVSPLLCRAQLLHGPNAHPAQAAGRRPGQRTDEQLPAQWLIEMQGRLQLVGHPFVFRRTDRKHRATAVGADADCGRAVIDCHCASEPMAARGCRHALVAHALRGSVRMPVGVRHDRQRVCRKDQQRTSHPPNQEIPDGHAIRGHRCLHGCWPSADHRLGRNCRAGRSACEFSCRRSRLASCSCGS